MSAVFTVFLNKDDDDDDDDDTFSNLASFSLAWVGIYKAEDIFLSDFHGFLQTIPWHDLLLRLEGQLVHLPAPKTHSTRNIELSAAMPASTTSREEFLSVIGVI